MADQINIAVTDLIPPANIATVDSNVINGNAYNKNQVDSKLNDITSDFNTKISEVREEVKTDFKGTLNPSAPSPTEDGSYKPEISSELDKPSDPNSTDDWGEIYPNAGNLRAKKGYDTLFYKKGTVWTKSEEKIPGVEKEFIKENYQGIEYFPYENKPVSELQQQVANAVKELLIHDYDENYNYYLIQFARNIDRSATGYTANDYVVKIKRNHKTTAATDTWTIYFGNTDPVEKVPTILSFQDKYTILIDWTKFPEHGNFDVDETSAYLLTAFVAKKEFSNTIISSQNYKENNEGKNVFLYGAGKDATANGEYNLGIGQDVMTNVDTAGYNIAIGYRSMKYHTTGAGNIAIGMDTLSKSTGVIDCTMVGWEAGKEMVTGVGDTGIGRRALQQTVSAGGNTAIGDSTLYSLQHNPSTGEGSSNIAIGYTSGEYCISVKDTIMIGQACARNVVSGENSIMLGTMVMFNRSTASNNNIAIGKNAMLTTTGNENVAIGSFVMNDNSGNENVVIGHSAGNSLISGSRNVVAGSGAQSGATNVSDSIVIGNSAKASKNKQIVIGNGVEEEFVICGVVFTKEKLQQLAL